MATAESGAIADASPAHAGIDRSAVVGFGAVACFPRTRGDRPLILDIYAVAAALPPHTRG